MLTVRARAGERAGEHEVGAAEGVLVEGEGAGGGELQATAAVLPGAGDEGEHDDGAGGGAAVFAALDAVVEADDGGTAAVAAGVGVAVGEGQDAVCGEAGDGGDAVWGVLGQEGVGAEIVGSRWRSSSR